MVRRAEVGRSNAIQFEKNDRSDLGSGPRRTISCWRGRREHAGSVRSQEPGHQSGARWKRAIPGTRPSVRSTLEACDPRNRAISPEHAGSVRSQEQGHRSGARWKRAIPGTRPSVRSTLEACDPRNKAIGPEHAGSVGSQERAAWWSCPKPFPHEVSTNRDAEILTYIEFYLPFLLTRFCLPVFTYRMTEPTAVQP